MRDQENTGLRLLAIMSELAADRGWRAAWAKLLDGSPAGAAALAEWLQAQPSKRREQLRVMFTSIGGHA